MRLKFIGPGNILVEIPLEIFRKFITTEYHGNPYWQYSRLLTRDDVMRYLKTKAMGKEVKDQVFLEKIAYYILVYAENTALHTFLWIYAEDKKEAREYMENTIPALEKLRRLYRIGRETGFTDKLVSDMLWTALDTGIDPF